jgi:ATP-dependent protease HslVU (ClpYQ) ATPase subunit
MTDLEGVRIEGHRDVVLVALTHEAARRLAACIWDGNLRTRDDGALEVDTMLERVRAALLEAAGESAAPTRPPAPDPGRH